MFAGTGAGEAQTDKQGAVVERMQTYEIAPNGGVAARIRSLIASVPDFPKPGVLFRDITPLLRRYWSAGCVRGRWGPWQGWSLGDFCLGCRWPSPWA